jgi:hypothetical protein
MDTDVGLGRRRGARLLAVVARLAPRVDRESTLDLFDKLWVEALHDD